MNLKVGAPLLCFGLLSVIGADAPRDPAVLIRDILDAEESGPRGDSLRGLMERNVYRLKFYSDTSRTRDLNILSALYRGYGMLDSQYVLMRDSALNRGNARRVDSLDDSRSRTAGYREKLGKILGQGP